jgi:hypothetical protein
MPQIPYLERAIAHAKSASRGYDAINVSIIGCVTLAAMTIHSLDALMLDTGFDLQSLVIPSFPKPALSEVVLCSYDD